LRSPFRRQVPLVRGPPSLFLLIIIFSFHPMSTPKDSPW
jgi:hypothetical protein